MKSLLIVVLIMVVLLPGYGCKQPQSQKPTETTGEPKQVPPPAPAEPNTTAKTENKAPAEPNTAAKTESKAPASSGVVAKVNGVEITGTRLDREVTNLTRYYQDQIPPEQLQQAMGNMRKQALENLINQQVLISEADKTGIAVTDDEVANKYKELSSEYPSEDKFKEQLAAIGLSEVLLRQEILMSLKIQKLIESVSPAKEPTDEQISAYYNQNMDKFQMQEQVKASHILFTVKADDPPEKRTERREALVKLRNDISNGADFATVAKANSDCPSKDQGGDLGFFTRGRMVKPFEDAAFQLKVGELSDIVETQFGYHIIKVTEHKDAQTVPIEQAKEQIKQMLNQEDRDKVINDYLTKLRDTSKIEYL